METQIVEVIQGSQEWLDFRATHFGASEAAAAMGLSPYMTRTELLTLKKTGIAKEVSATTQAIFDKGHEVEALAREIIEARLDEELFSATYKKGKLSASVDGIDLHETFGWECKQFNQALFDSVVAGVLPEQYKPQVQQCMYVTGVSRWIFTVSDGTEKGTVSLEVGADAAYISKIIQAWDQFDKDLADFVPVTHAEKPKAEPVKALPALAIQIKGEVSLSNLPRFKEAADAFVATIKTDLQTDQDFADAVSNVKFLDEAEKSLEHAKKAALSQTADIDELMRTIDQIKDSMRTKRLALDKLVKSKKEEIKSDIVLAAQQKLAAHVAELNVETKPVVISVLGDFGLAIKGKRSISSLHDAVDTELSRCKIYADSLAANVRKNLALLDKQAPTQKALFADLATLALQSFETFSAIVENRLAAELARVAKIEAEAKARAEAQAAAAIEAKAEAAHQAENAKIRAASNAMLAMKAQEAPVAVLKEKSTPSLREIASLVAFDYAVDAKTATAWIINAVNHYQQEGVAA